MFKKKVVLMAVSSSGGHIYPALALAEKLSDLYQEKKQLNSLKIHIVHPNSFLSRKILQSTPYTCHTLSLGGMAKGQSLLRRLKTLSQLPTSFLKAFTLIQKIKPDVILGTGGSVTVPFLLIGFLLRKKRAIWEGNLKMGLANRISSFFTNHVFTAFPFVENLNPKKQIWSAYPLRKKVQKETPVKKDFFPENKFKVLVLGGSQGSMFLNQVVSEALIQKDWRKDIIIYHQTGYKYFKPICEKYKSLKNVFPFSFSSEIRNYYKGCDLIFSRAGAGSILEVAFFGKSLVLIPITHSAGGHQLKNALNLFSKSCVDMILEKDFNAESFKKKILELKEDEKDRENLGRKLSQIPNKEDKILNWILRDLCI
ncbi:MAG: UDP-N-acetylglucosamine--N-acetylmuramyl-(pentapeptide) pyrophosphoryl-undecaprenol N-acetylglucosamine transferase [Bdellovibrionales bacterium]|nr:UDP-N-acetylglucosamine--N-acetylmuramyl-(pentapeptide) pyrophosphoryl-undecaprenol N-acetylglucosamine transferase [Bdellovibrionales bacterium]